jgi:hypothetical protein
MTGIVSTEWGTFRLSLFVHVHIDYRGLFEGHYHNYNSDVRAVGPERRGGQPINNYERYKSWFGPIPGYTP